jgi:hypothetical protein
MPRIAARYIGTSPVFLMPRPGDPYLDANGAPLQPRETPFSGNKGLFIAAGESLMLEEAEVLGQTLLYDAHGNNNPVTLGVGCCLLPQHQGQDWHTLSGVPFTYDGTAPGVLMPAGMVAYEFHEGRPDFAPFTPDPRAFDYVAPVASTQAPPVAPQAPATAAKVKETQAPVTLGITDASTATDGNKG